MKQFTITQTDLIVDGQKELLIMAEIHYFRIHPSVWERAVDLAAEAGCNSVAFYVPWFVHEPQEGQFRFDGDDNLTAFLELLHRKKLWAFPRIGPYIYAESANYGIPQWFLDNYPNAHIMQYENGGAVDNGQTLSAGHNHPDFLAAVTRWSNEVIRVIAPYQMPQGPVFMVQACNEIPGEDTDDQNPQNLGIGQAQGRHPSFLRSKYKTVGQLNAVYGTQFTSLEDIYPAQLAKADPVRALGDHLSYYYEHYFPSYFQTLISVYRAAGLRVALCHNAYNPRAVSLHVHNKRQNPELFIGVDCYYALHGRLSAQSANYYCEYGPAYIHGVLQNAPWVVEHQCGYWNDFPAVYGKELYLWNIWAVAGGYRGFNMYLFTGGANRPGMGFFGNDHNWQAPVTLDAEKWETYGDIRQSIADIRLHADVLTAPRIHDIALGHSCAPGLIWRPLSQQTANAYYLLSQTGCAPEVCDYQSMPLEELCRRPALWVVSDGRMEPETQQKLLDYVQSGGQLVLQGAFPALDHEGNPAEQMAQTLGITAQAYTERKKDQCKLLLNGTEHYIGRTVQPVDWPEAQSLAFTTDGQAAIVTKTYGQGRIVLLPFHMEYLFHSQCRVVDYVLSLCGAPPLVRGQKRLRAIVKEGRRAVVFNVHPVPVTETLTLGESDIPLTLMPLSYQILSF